jgi:DNA-binding HxlR family transcriptional regulator
MSEIEVCEGPCPVERGMRLLGGKWTGSILWHLQNGPLRFNELARVLSGASKKMVTQRLSTMEEDGLVAREVRSEKPIAVFYSLTPKGTASLKIFQTVAEWVDIHNL